MKVLHVMTAIDRGGAENHLVELVRHQRAQGIEVTVAHLRGHGYWTPTLRKMGATVNDLRLRFYGDFRPLRLLRRLLAESSFDLIHAHLPPAELYVRLALLGRPAVPLVITKHNDCPFHRIPGERALGRWVAERASSVIAISEAVRQYMIGPALGLPPGQVQTIYYGLDVQPYDEVDERTIAELRGEWGVAPGTLVIGFAGRLVEQKSIDVLLRAFAQFARGFTGETRLVIAGRGPLDETLRQVASDIGIADRVVWAGFREDVPRMMRAFDVFAITSAHEGFGLVLAEAMAARCPIVATRAGAIPEVVVHEETGLLAEIGDVAGIAEALRRMGDPAFRRRLGEAGRQRVLSEFTLEKMWRETDALYGRCLAGEKGVLTEPALSR